MATYTSQEGVIEVRTVFRNRNHFRNRRRSVSDRFGANPSHTIYSDTDRGLLVGFYYYNPSSLMSVMGSPKVEVEVTQSLKSAVNAVCCDINIFYGLLDGQQQRRRLLVQERQPVLMSSKKCRQEWHYPWKKRVAGFAK